MFTPEQDRSLPLTKDPESPVVKKPPRSALELLVEADSSVFRLPTKKVDFLEKADNVIDETVQHPALPQNKTDEDTKESVDMLSLVDFTPVQ